MWHFVLAWIQVWCKEAGASQSPTPLREFMDLRCGYLVVRRKETSQPVSSTFRESNRKVSLFEGLCLRRRVPDIAKQTSTRRPKQLETWSRHAMTGLPMALILDHPGTLHAGRRTMNSADPRHVKAAVPSLQAGSDVLATSVSHISVLAQHLHKLLM